VRVNVPVLLGVGVRVLVNVGETTGVFVAVPAAHALIVILILVSTCPPQLYN
jgi:hypothetical protein